MLVDNTFLQSTLHVKKVQYFMSDKQNYNDNANEHLS